jgi:single-strand DNA-binding protein
LVASSRKKVDEEWVDDKTCWLSSVAFKKVAENIADSISKGDLVLVNGKLQTEEWETKEGEKRSSYVVVVDTIGPSLAFNPASSVKAERTEKAAPADDPWTTPSTEEPPF